MGLMKVSVSRSDVSFSTETVALDSNNRPVARKGWRGGGYRQHSSDFVNMGQAGCCYELSMAVESEFLRRWQLLVLMPR